MADTQKKEATAVISALRKFNEDIDNLIELIPEGPSLSQKEDEKLQGELKDLKARLRVVAYTGTLDGAQRELTKFERDVLKPAARETLTTCYIAAGTHPIRMNWDECLRKMKADLTRALHKLEKKYPGV